MGTAEARGEARGRADGEYKKAVAIAKRLLAKGMMVEEIADAAELPV